MLAGPGDDIAGALAALAERVGAGAGAAAGSRRRGPTGRPARSPREAVAAAVGALLPEGAIVVRRGATRRASGSPAPPPARRSTTGSRSPAAPSARGLPVAVGAAVACPDRPVVEPPGRRQRDVHDPVAVDDGPREPRRDDGDLQQPLLRHPQHGAAPRRRRRRAAQGQGHARPRAGPTSTSSPSPPAWAFPPCRAPMPRTSPSQLERSLAEPGPAPHRGGAPRPPLRRAPLRSGGWGGGVGRSGR